MSKFKKSLPVVLSILIALIIILITGLSSPKKDNIEEVYNVYLDGKLVGAVKSKDSLEKYIDEERFCRAFVNDKYRFAKWGKVKIAQALQLKKVSYNVCRRFLNEIDEEEYLSILDSLLAAKRKSVHAENEYELNGKLMRFALSRGFEMKDIRHCIQLSDENDDFE
jgi:hypothetical protein